MEVDIDLVVMPRKDIEKREQPAENIDVILQFDGNQLFLSFLFECFEETEDSCWLTFFVETS